MFLRISILYPFVSSLRISLCPPFVPQVRLENTQTLANDPIERKIPILQLPHRIWARAAQRVFTPLQPLHPEGRDQKGGKDGKKDGRRVRRPQQSDHLVVFEGRATLIWDRYGRKRRREEAKRQRDKDTKRQRDEEAKRRKDTYSRFVLFDVPTIRCVMCR